DDEGDRELQHLAREASVGTLLVVEADLFEGFRGEVVDRGLVVAGRNELELRLHRLVHVVLHERVGIERGVIHRLVLVLHGLYVLCAALGVIGAAGSGRAGTAVACGGAVEGAAEPPANFFRVRYASMIGPRSGTRVVAAGRLRFLRSALRSTV